MKCYDAGESERRGHHDRYDRHDQSARREGGHGQSRSATMQMVVCVPTVPCLLDVFWEDWMI